TSCSLTPGRWGIGSLRLSLAGAGLSSLATTQYRRNGRSRRSARGHGRHAPAGRRRPDGADQFEELELHAAARELLDRDLAVFAGAVGLPVLDARPLEQLEDPAGILAQVDHRGQEAGMVSHPRVDGLRDLVCEALAFARIAVEDAQDGERPLVDRQSFQCVPSAVTWPAFSWDQGRPASAWSSGGSAGGNRNAAGFSFSCTRYASIRPASLPMRVSLARRATYIPRPKLTHRLTTPMRSTKPKYCMAVVRAGGRDASTKPRSADENATCRISSVRPNSPPSQA